MNETLQTAPVSLTVPPAKTKSFLLELVWASLRHDLDASAVALGARAAVSADDLDAATTDALWFVSLAVESDAPKRARLADLARALVDTEGVVRKSTLMERCEGEFLEEAGFVASASAFRKKEIRVNTRVVYTQKKFNLLREESEGYAKVLAVLAAFADTNANTKKQSRVSGAVRAVQSLIGAFDLDPNRVLDLTLEACELAPAERAPEFGALFRLFRAENVAQVLGFAFQNHAGEVAREKEAARAAAVAAAAARARRAARAARRRGAAAKASDAEAFLSAEASSSSSDEREDEEEEAGEVAADAPKLALASDAAAETAASSAAAAAARAAATPESLYRLAASLVKSGVVDADDVYAHLSPSDEELVERRASQVKTRLAAARKIGVINLLASAPPPPDDDDDESMPDTQSNAWARPAPRAAAPPPAAPEPEPPSSFDVASTRVDDFEDQKLGFLRGCLAVGERETASRLLRRFATLGLDPAEDEDVSTRLLDAFATAAEGAYGAIAPAGCGAAIRQRGDVAGMEEPSHFDSGDSAEIPPILSPDIVEPLLCLGPYLSRDAAAFAKACRLTRAQLERAARAGFDASPIGRALAATCEAVLGESLLPSLTLMFSNASASDEVWAAMRLLPATSRFRLYSAWQGEGLGDAPTDAEQRLRRDGSARPALVAARRAAEAEAKAVMRRLSKDNVREFGRKLAKAAHANPIAVLATVTKQIEAYTNMIAPVTDAFKYLTALSFDALTFVVVEKLAEGREKLKEDGQNVSLWLQALATFCGHLARKHARDRDERDVKGEAGIDLGIILQYLVCTLRDDQSLDLLVLKEIILRATGSEALEDLSDAQIDAMAGGPILRAEAVSAGGPLFVPARARARGIARLKDALRWGAPGGEPLTVPLLVLTARRKRAIAFDGGGLIREGADAAHLKLVSSLHDGCQEAFALFCQFLETAFPDVDEYARVVPYLRDLVHTHGLEPAQAFHAYRPVLRRLKPPSPEEEAGKNETEAGKQTEAPPALEAGDVRVTRRALLRDVAEMLPGEVWRSISPELYLAFWSLSPYDLESPTARYESETERCRVAVDALEREIAKLSNGAGKTAASAETLKQKRKEKERLRELGKALAREMAVQEKDVAAVTKRLRLESASFLTDSNVLSVRGATTTVFAQRCALPRLALSHADARFCASFVERLHCLRTPWFSTITYLNVVFGMMQNLSFSRTNYEAGRLGTFLGATLATVRRWKDDVDGAFARDCEDSVGFAMRPSEGDAGKKASREDFYKLAHKWHVRVGKAFINCLEETEYMSLRNALAVLTRVTSEFPATRRVGAHILRAAEKIQKTDARGDLKTVAARYLAMLNKAKSGWVSDHGFNPHHPMDAKELEEKAARARNAAERAARSSKRTADKSNAEDKSRGAPRRDGAGGSERAGAADGKTPALSAGAREFTPTKAPGAGPRAGRDRDRSVRAPAAASDGGAGGGAKRRRADDADAGPSKRFRSDEVVTDPRGHKKEGGGGGGGGRGGGRGDARGGGRDARDGGGRDRDDRGGRGARGDRDRNVRGGDRGRDAPRATRVVRR